MSERFKVVSGSQSAHRRFDATVVDTTKPFVIGGVHLEGQYESVCECFELGDAQLIADALNANSPPPP